MALFSKTDCYLSLSSKTKIKVKAVPLHHAGAKGERTHGSYSFLMSARDTGEWSALRPGRALPPGKDRRYQLDRRLGGYQSRSLDPEARGKIFSEDRTPVVQFVVGNYTEWATPAPEMPT
jgi:hypothetical protein